MGNRRQPPEDDADRGYFSYDGLNRVMHEKARLGILTALRTRLDWLLFGDLKGLCTLTDGNLSRHLTVLQEAGLIAVRKGQEGGRPQTWLRLTPKGKKEFDTYLEELHRVIQDASIQVHPGTQRGDGDTPPGLLPV
jgi:DNA-binding MarR family transcriptional regulator